MTDEPKKRGPVGRPSSYRPEYCDQVVACLAEGHSVTAFAGRIGVARSTVFKWAEEHQEFSDSLKVGQARAVEVWEKALLDVAKNGGGNATAAIFGLKNRAADDWRDKQEHEHTGKDGKDLIPDDADPERAARRILFALEMVARSRDADVP